MAQVVVLLLHSLKPLFMQGEKIIEGIDFGQEGLQSYGGMTWFAIKLYPSDDESTIAYKVARAEKALDGTL